MKRQQIKEREMKIKVVNNVKFKDKDTPREFFEEITNRMKIARGIECKN